MKTTMLRHPHIVAFFNSLSVASLAGAEDYYRTIQREHYVGVPGLNISSSCLIALSVELNAFRLTEPQECVNLWLFEKPSGGAFITTSLHHHRPGVAFSEFLKSRQLSDELQTFLVEWQKMVGVYFALSCLYIQTDPGERVIEMEQATGLN